VIYLSIAIVVLIEIVVRMNYLLNMHTKAIVTNQLAILYWGEKFEEKEK